IFFVCAWFVPESPRWLVKNRRRAAAERVLMRIGGAGYAAAALRQIEETIHPALAKRSGAWRELVGRGMRRVLLIGVVLAVLQQWSGINVIFNYAEEVYRSAGYGISGVLFNIVITGAINVICTLIALGFVDKVGRRPLLLIGCAGVGVSHFFIGLAYHFGFSGLPLLILTLCAIGCYAMSLAPITWIIISEIFPNRIRGMAVSVSVSALWIASFLLTYTFPLIDQAIGPAGSFWLYAGICFCGLLFAWREVPETKGKSLESIEEQLVRRTAAKPRAQKVRAG
ncbi:MAG: MFS transporter, partial [Bryobacteraceae bacterium]